MKAPCFLAAALAAAGLVLAAAATADELTASSPAKVTLRYKFQPGETLRWEVVQRTKVKTSALGNTQMAETVTKSIKAWRVENVEPNGAATFVNSVESVDLWQKISGRQEERYNSQTDREPPPGFKNMAESVGVPLSTITMDATGQILHRSGTSKAHTVDNEGQITIQLPKEPVAVGESWSMPYQIDVPYGTAGAVKKIKTAQKYTLLSLKTGIATIEMVTQILTPVHDPAIEAQLIQREQNGTVRFDVDAGRVVSQQIDVDKQVVGFSGEASSLHYLTRFTEELLPAASRTASREKPSESKTE